MGRAVQEGFLEPPASSLGLGTRHSHWDRQGPERPRSWAVVLWPGRCTLPQWSGAGPRSAKCGALGCFTLQMLQQSLREQELRAQHLAALLRLREKALEKTRWELAWLEHQRRWVQARAPPPGF